jgi:phage recombination protein Bet
VTDAIVKSEMTEEERKREARRELVRRTICPKGIPADEFDLFWEQCDRSGLDPLLKEAFCVGRRMNVGTKDKPNWTTKYEFQPSEAGMLARAERFPDFKGIQASAVYAEDEILIDQGSGEVTHRFNPAKRKGSLVGAWARVVRAGKLPIVVWLDFTGYVQPTPLWAKIPTTMIEKCSRVAALRKAYPEAFGEMYVREEMPAEEFVDAESSNPIGQTSKPALPAASATVLATPTLTLEDRRDMGVTADLVATPIASAVVGISREPGEDDAEAEAVDPVAQEADALIVALGLAKTIDDVRGCHKRAMSLKGTSEYARVSAAYVAARDRVNAKPAAEATT